MININDAMPGESHSELNPKLWEGDDLKLEARVALLKSAMAFYKFLEIPELELAGVHLVGSNASYNYTDFSDCDVHLIVDYSATDFPDLAENFFMAKKSLWNSKHENVTIKGHPVELYVEDTKKPVKAAGIYDLVHGSWISKPSPEEGTVDQRAVRAKVTALSADIENAAASENEELINQTIDKLRTMRQSGLERAGEFSVENLTFKTLRNMGFLDVLYQAKADAQDAELTVEGECELNELARPETKMDAGQILTQAGYEKAGSGMFADVWTKPESNYALKLFDSSDDSYVDFVKMARQHKSPYFPEFKGSLIKVTSEYYGVRLEKLSGHPDDSFAEIIQKYADYRYRSLTNRIQPDDTFDSVISDMADLEAAYSGLTKACDIMAQTLAKTPSRAFDIHKHNIMMRGTTPVIIDPFW